MSFSSAAYTAVEGAAGATVTVRMQPAPAERVTVRLEATPQGGATQADFSGVPQSLTFEPGDTSRRFTVTATEDAENDDGERVLISFAALPEGILAGTPATATVTLVATEVSVWYLSFGQAEYDAVEGGAGARVVARLNAPWKPDRNKTLTVTLHAFPGGGAHEGDYSGVPGSVSFPPGVTEASFTVTATDDAEDDDGESVVLRFGFDVKDLELSPNAPARTTVRLVDNDGVRPVTVSFGAQAYEAAEGGAPVAVKVVLSAPPGRQVRIPIRHRGHNGATAGDYTGVPGSVVFGAGETEKVFEVSAADDFSNDDLEYVRIGFGALPRGVSAGNPSGATVNLRDNDGARKNVEVRFSGTASATPEGRSMTVHVFTDVEVSYSLSIPIEVEHLGGATAADYTGAPTTVSLDRTSEFGTRFGTFTFKVLEDAEAGETGEGVRLTFGDLPAGVSARPGRSRFTIRFLDNDGFPSVRVSGGSVREGANPQSYADFEVTLEHEAEYEVKVDYATADGTAVVRQDYEPESGTLTFAPGHTSRIVRVKVCADGIPERNRDVRAAAVQPGARLDPGQRPGRGHRARPRRRRRAVLDRGLGGGRRRDRTPQAGVDRAAHSGPGTPAGAGQVDVPRAPE